MAELQWNNILLIMILVIVIFIIILIMTRVLKIPEAVTTPLRPVMSATKNFDLLLKFFKKCFENNLKQEIFSQSLLCEVIYKKID